MKPELNATPLRWNWVFQTAFRDTRGSRGKALLYALSMALGMASLVAMMSFNADIRQALQGKTRELVGADLILMSRQPFSADALALMNEVPGSSADITRFATMAYFPEQDEASFSRLRAIRGDFPFFGKLETEPASAAQRFRTEPVALVENTLLERTGATIGDTIRVGERSFEIGGSLIDTPNEPATASLFGARIYISGEYLTETDLIRPGSRVFYSKAYRTDPTFDVDAWVETNKENLRSQRLTFETVESRKERIGRFLEHLGNFLRLTSCLALLLGGVGVASAVYYHVRQKRRQIAVMRCLGIPIRHIVTVYLVQITAMALFAMVLGAAFGVALQFFMPVLVGRLFPFEFEATLQPLEIAIASLWGLVMSLLLALAPLVTIRKVSPLVSLRIHLTESQADWLQRLTYFSIILVWWAFAIWQTTSFKIGSYFLLGLIGGIGLLALTARALGWLAKHVLSPGLPFTWRHGVASLFRPQNQTSVMTVILGLGIFMIAILTGSRSMLLNQFESALSVDKPNFIAFDIQQDQVEGVKQVVRDNQLQIQQLVPITAIRLSKVDGTSVADLMNDPDIPSWTLQREYRSTYRGSLTETEELVAGEWISRYSGEGDIPVSLETDIAENLQVGLGDTLEVDVFGLPMTLRIASLRKVDWESLQPNFFILFPEGVLEEAPQQFLLTTRTSGPKQVADLQRELVKSYPNVTCADMTQLIRNIDELIQSAAAGIRFFAGLCILSGLLLMGSALWNSRYERRGEHALLRTLGAKGGQVVRIALTEYFLLGLFASLTGSVLGLLANWGIGKYLFEIDALPGWQAVLMPLLALPALTVIMGLLSHPDLGNKGALNVLKAES